MPPHTLHRNACVSLNMIKIQNVREYYTQHDCVSVFIIYSHQLSRNIRMLISSQFATNSGGGSSADQNSSLWRLRWCNAHIGVDSIRVQRQKAAATAAQCCMSLFVRVYLISQTLARNNGNCDRVYLCLHSCLGYSRAELEEMSKHNGC